MANDNPNHEFPGDEALYRASGCFACGTTNEYGLDMAPYRVGDEVFATFTPKPFHRGWSKLVHGGILSTALDEVVCLAAGNVANKKVLTVKAEVKYLAPAFIGQELRVRGWPTEKEGRYQTAEGEITDSKGKVLATGRIHCLAVDGAKAAQFLDDKKPEKQ